MIETITKQDVIDRCVKAYDAGNGVELSHEELGLLMSVPQQQHKRHRPWIPITCRWCRNWIKDSDAVMDIEMRTYLTTAWTREDFGTIFSDARNYCLIAETLDRKIVGYLMVVMPYQDIAAQIINLTVDPDYLRQGVGTQMVEWLITHQHGRRINVMVIEDNLEGLLFLKSIGFRATDINKAAYAGRDGIMMEYSDAADRATDQ